MHADVVIVGGGIAGGALATVLARSGLEVVVLERDPVYRDRNKGECIMAWGFAELSRLGLVDVLDAAGGRANPTWTTANAAGARKIPVGLMRADAPGTYSVLHPDARSALVGAAAAAGATVRFGVDRVTVGAGDQPSVHWHDDGGEAHASCRLVIGADGRSSTVRRQLRVPMHRTERTHVVSACLFSNTRELGDSVHVASADSRVCFAVPVGDGCTRMYLVTRAGSYSGADGAERFHRDCVLPGIEEAERWANGEPVARPTTYGGEDTWVADPVVRGAALIGDAAGYNSPFLGQGLSLALADARGIADLLLGGNPWTPDGLAPWVAERSERLRRLRVIALTWGRFQLQPDDVLLPFAGDPLVLRIFAGFIGGFDEEDPSLFSEATAEHLLGAAA